MASSPEGAKTPQRPRQHSGRQTLAAMRAAVRQNLAATNGCHACAEAVAAFAHELARLIGSLHGTSPGLSAAPCTAPTFRGYRSMTAYKDHGHETHQKHAPDLRGLWRMVSSKSTAQAVPLTHQRMTFVVRSPRIPRRMLMRLRCHVQSDTGHGLQREWKT